LANMVYKCMLLGVICIQDSNARSLLSNSAQY